MSGHVVTLAQERRSQPQQIADLQARYSDLVQRFALDSQTLHTARLEHDAALVHHTETIDAHYTEWTQDSKYLWELMREHERRLDTFHSLTFWQRMRWLIRG